MSEPAIDYGRFDALTFDCYGTLIDWETGILAGLRASLAGLRRPPSDDELLERYAGAEAALEAGPYLRYREILARGLAEVCRAYGVEPTDAAAEDLFAGSNRRLGIEFDWIVTAESVGSYKPNPRNFTIALERIGVPGERVLHVAQSLFHDHVPAGRLGLSSVWIDRRHGQAGSGATPPADARPGATFPDMASFAEAATRR
jgi:2-haloacid dehalogenase